MKNDGGRVQIRMQLALPENGLSITYEKEKKMNDQKEGRDSEKRKKVTEGKNRRTSTTTTGGCGRVKYIY